MSSSRVWIRRLAGYGVPAALAGGGRSARAGGGRHDAGPHPQGAEAVRPGRAGRARPGRRGQPPVRERRRDRGERAGGAGVGDPGPRRARQGLEGPDDCPAAQHQPRPRRVGQGPDGDGRGGRGGIHTYCSSMLTPRQSHIQD